MLQQEQDFIHTKEIQGLGEEDETDVNYISSFKLEDKDQELKNMHPYTLETYNVRIFMEFFPFHHYKLGTLD